MDKSLEVINIKNEPIDSISIDHLEIPTKMQVGVKQENNYLIHSEFCFKTEPQEDENKFPIIAGSSYDMCPNDNIKTKTEEPLIKIENEDVQDEILQDPLDVGSDIKIEEHFSIDLEQSEARIKTEVTDRENEENLLESNENISNPQDQLLIRSDTHRKDKKYICNECNKTFRWKSRLDEHLRIHTGEKPFSCDICKKSFSQKGTLDGHMLIHSSKKPHSCDVCRKVFSRKSYLVSHTLRHSEVKSFSCKICKKSFNRRDNLDGHMLTHSGVKQFLCDVCKKSFARKQDLVVHKRIHTGDKRFTCNMCDKAYIRKSGLNIHTRTHTGEKPFSCDVCNKSFARKSNLNQHKKIHQK